MKLSGGFAEFSFKLSNVCDSGRSRCSLLYISKPCSLPHCPPAEVLPFLYLGCEKDAMSVDFLTSHRIKYVLNVSNSALDSPYISNRHYLRIPVNDAANENIVEWFQTAFDFIDGVKDSGGHLLVHCVGGVSRSATLAIAYVMKHLSLPLDKAYRYVKDKRPMISPNLNFMGQLLQYEKQLLSEREQYSDSEDLSPTSQEQSNDIITQNPLVSQTTNEYIHNIYTDSSHTDLHKLGSNDSDLESFRQKVRPREICASTNFELPLCKGKGIRKRTNEHLRTNERCTMNSDDNHNILSRDIAE